MLSPSSHPTPLPSLEGRNLEDLIPDPSGFLRFGEQQTKELQAPIPDPSPPPGPLDSSHSPGVAAAFTPSLNQGLPGDLATDLHACSHSPRGLSPAQAFPSGNESWGKGRKRLGLPLAAYLLGSGLVLRPSCLLSPFILTTFLWGGQDDSIFQIRRLKLKEGLQGSPLANHQALQVRRGRLGITLKICGTPSICEHCFL